MSILDDPPPLAIEEIMDGIRREVRAAGLPVLHIDDLKEMLAGPGSAAARLLGHNHVRVLRNRIVRHQVV